ncbi:MAG: 2-amino-4-hydroxy-6-hydroxymethyldihydropteridine diphosphokinase [Gaiellaceae bacterium]|jgi:2-amino-4-hydroxy-6-hydroxymethyldihydropteridine diphosphokinase|nr:2-amino-4-hydroxy-6-hydroxymethyldihydropteridine diphosphokinase [Gaiellaceae bacterium]
MSRAYVGLGANIGNPQATIHRAVELLSQTQQVTLVALSTLRETEPVGFVDQPRFLNGAAAIDTELSARALLDRLLEIEQELGRTRSGLANGPRTIDLDLLLYDQVELKLPGLTLPHPRLHVRCFALEPLAELDADLEIPGRGPIQLIMRRLHCG